MSEYAVRVVRLGKIGKHPNADTLSITQVNGSYPVICKSGLYENGSLAVHVPPDALVDVRLPWFSWLADKANHLYLHRVRFAKLRGVPSYGFLVPISDIPDGHLLSEGQEVSALLGVTKYEPEPVFNQGEDIQGAHFSTAGLAMVPHYDIEGLRKHEALFTPGEEVWVSEKIHGSNGRWVHLDGQLFSGSRTKFRTGSVWNRMAERYRLEEILGLPENQGKVLYGEVYGPGIQDLTYGLTEPQVLFFDLFDSKTGKWVNVADFQKFCTDHGLPQVPTLFHGPFNLESLYAMAEGKSTLVGANHVREGIVVKPVEERWDSEGVGRVFLKLPGEGYLLRKSA